MIGRKPWRRRLLDVLRRRQTPPPAPDQPQLGLRARPVDGVALRADDLLTEIEVYLMDDPGRRADYHNGTLAQVLAYKLEGGLEPLEADRMIGRVLRAFHGDRAILDSALAAFAARAAGDEATREIRCLLRHGRLLEAKAIRGDANTE